MAIMMRKSNNSEGDNNIFWTTMADLLLGLAIIFMTLFVLAMTGFTQQELEQKQQQIQVNKELIENIKKANIEAQVDPMTGDIKISDLELFEINSYELSEKGKKYLNKFAPAYFNSLFTNDYLNKNIAKIIVQGHTDSQTYKGKFSEDEQYMKNMELSLKRAYSVANYMISTQYNKENGNKLRKMIIVEGASFSSPILINGKEDFTKSRRVELKLVMKNEKKQQGIIQQERK